MAAPTTTETFLNQDPTPVHAHKPETVMNTRTSTFRDRFTFTDHALGLEFKDKEGLTEFLAKARGFFPDSFAFTMPSSPSIRERLRCHTCRARVSKRLGLTQCA